MGKPVEINALWYHALRFVEELGGEHGRGRAADGGGGPRSARRFWNERDRLPVRRGRWRGAGRTPRCAPTRSWPCPSPTLLLEPAQASAVVRGGATRAADAVRAAHALARTTRATAAATAAIRSPATAPTTRARCGPGCSGPFVTAYLKVSEDQAAAQQIAPGLAGVARRAPARGRAGTDLGDLRRRSAPRPCGCVAQAWSVAEVLRASVEDLGGLDMVETEVPTE